MSKAGKAGDIGVTSIGREHPQPENIPHLSSPIGNGSTNGSVSEARSGSIPGGSSGSPVKESSFLQRETSVDEGNILSPQSPKSPVNQDATNSPPQQQSVPVRWRS